MNAKKIMGAVLVALLAAALFVGAGAAAGTDYGTVFVYQDLKQDSSTAGITGTWTLGASSITVIDDGAESYFAGDKIAEGQYKQGDDKLTLKYPVATFTGKSTSSNPYLIIDGGSFYDNSSSQAVITATSGAKAATVVTIGDLLATYPDGTSLKVGNPSTFTWSPGMPTGTYKINAIYGGGFVTGTPDDVKISKNAFSFKVVRSDEVTVTASADTVIKGKTVKLTITGIPDTAYEITGKDVSIVSTGIATPLVVLGNTIGFIMPNTGKAIIDVKVDKTCDIGIEDTKSEKATITITAEDGVITATAEKDAYYIGNEIKLSGTSNVGGQLYFAIEGTNIDFFGFGNPISVDSGKWEEKIQANIITDLKLDAGTYTVYIGTNNAAWTNNDKTGFKKDTYTTLSLVLKQPFITITEAPAVAVKGNDFIVKGEAEAAKKVQYYVFGTNFFASAIVDVNKNKFEVEIEDSVTDTMAAGQYFIVIQHPMYDTFFNIAPYKYGLKSTNWEIYKNPTGTATFVDTLLFDIFERQKTNAAQALCDELDKQDIDDMYVKASFVVAAPLSTINALPSEITKGSKLTVSGTTNVGEGKLVTVEMLSTAFAAVPKETVGSAAFVALTTKTDKDGNWVVEFDTSSLNVDEYTVSVAVESLDSTTAKINIIEGAPVQPTETGTQPTETVVPTETQQPTQTPTTPPKTPGFGALAALAGLGAVAVLLLRRE